MRPTTPILVAALVIFAAPAAAQGTRLLRQPTVSATQIDVPLDARSVAAGRDPQLERGVAEALKLLQQSNIKPLTLPPASKRARWPQP